MANEAKGGAGPALYRGMDRAALDAAYSASLSIPDVDRWRNGWVERSEHFRQMHRGQLDLPYGDAPRTKLDFFPADAPGAPTVLFIHGGYWRRNSKDNFSFVAAGPLAHGFNVAMLSHTLAPEARMDRIVGEVAGAATWLAAHLGRLGGDPNRLYAAGWSAGGHLVAMIIGHPAIKAGVAVSGIYDLEPIRLGEVNDAVRLDEAEARRNSPMLAIPAHSAPLVIGVGGDELPEFRRQAAEYAAARQAMGARGRLIELPGCHHYAALDQLANPDGKMALALKALADGELP